MPDLEFSEQGPRLDRSYLKQVLFLAEQAVEGDLKVVPGKKWALHYPQGKAVRDERLQGLLDGRYQAEEVADDLKPDALLYDVGDIESLGLEGMRARIRDISSSVAHYDHKRFAELVSQMGGTGATLEQVQEIYESVAQNRTRKKMMDAYGMTGRRQMKEALKQEGQRSMKRLAGSSGLERVLETLKLNWLHEKHQLFRSDEIQDALSKLSEDEQAVYDRLKDSFSDFIERGSGAAYEAFVQGVLEGLPKEEAAEEAGEMSESMEELQEELEEFMDKVVPPGMPEDPAIPPDDKDEYHTPPGAEPGESFEKAASRPIYEIRPSGTSKAPLVGNYCCGRKSHYDVDQKTWSKKKQVSPYTSAIAGDKRQTISGVLDAGLKALPIPNHYGLDLPSLKYEGAKPKILRDQNGCFYLESTGHCEFSVDFLKEDPKFVGPPIPEDTEALYRGSLSAETEGVISGLQGAPLDMALEARQHILNNHYYPGGGDLQSAQALQFKLRSESTGDDYLQKVDQSEYLECYSANTLFVAMMRKAKVSARLVIGHMIDSAKEGKAVIDGSTGHAWSEIWDGQEWIRVDATPKPKLEDKKKEEGEKGDDTPTEQAEDGGAPDAPDEEKLTEEVKEKVEERAEELEQEGEAGEMGEASDEDMEAAEQDFQDAQQEMQQMEQAQQEMKEKIDQAENFQDLDQAKQELEQQNLLDEMEEELQDKLEAKENEMKEELEDKLDQMGEDGFLDEDQREELQDKLDEMDLKDLDRLKAEIEAEARLYDDYDAIREEVEPLVDEWFEYFVERLPRHLEIEADMDSLSRQGAFSRRAVQHPRNILFGTVKHPRVFRPEVKPKFLASIMLDVSVSMAGQKLQDARKLLVFYCELFSRLTKTFGYIRFAINIFSDSVKEIKDYDQDYDSVQHYDFSDGTSSTIKVRLMKELHVQGGTNMLDAVKKSAQELTEETFEYPDYVSAYYFVGDGEDTCGNSDNVRKFLELNDSEMGFGEHLLSATMLGNESQRQTLAGIFGEEHTSVAPDLDTLIEQSMEQFDEDISDYVDSLP